MIPETIVQIFRQKVCEKISLESEGIDRYIVFTPFMFDDGDHLPILLKQENGHWYLSDEGHTFMHISYDEIDIEKGRRAKIIDTVLGSYKIKNIEGELRAYIENENYGDALYSFIQGLIKITDISYWTKEGVRGAFLEDFKALLEEKIPEDRRVFNYSDLQHDVAKKYIVDCRINGAKRPLFVFAVLNNDRCRDATITCLQYEKFGVPFVATAIFENQEKINRRVLARFSDVCEKQFPSLQSAKERFDPYWKEILER
ncbi:MAG: DUF1828 domain-containing protein [bacterium]